jgi:general secretion pathway protein G
MPAELPSSGKRRTLAIFIVIVGSLSAAFSLQRRSIEVRESQLRARLWALNTVLHEYVFDKQRVPRTVGELIQEHYLREVPVDPFTGSNSTWRIVPNKQKIYSLVAPGGKTITLSEVWGVAVKSGSTNGRSQ